MKPLDKRIYKVQVYNARELEERLNAMKPLAPLPYGTANEEWYYEQILPTITNGRKLYTVIWVCEKDG